MMTVMVGAHRYRLPIKGSQTIAFHKKELEKKMKPGKMAAMFKGVEVIPYDEQKWELEVQIDAFGKKHCEEDSYVLSDSSLPSQCHLVANSTVRVTRQKVVRSAVVGHIEPLEVDARQRVLDLYNNLYIPKTPPQ